MLIRYRLLLETIAITATARKNQRDKK